MLTVKSNESVNPTFPKLFYTLIFFAFGHISLEYVIAQQAGAIDLNSLRLKFDIYPTLKNTLSLLPVRVVYERRVYRPPALAKLVLGAHRLGGNDAGFILLKNMAMYRMFHLRSCLKVIYLSTKQVIWAMVMSSRKTVGGELEREREKKSKHNALQHVFREIVELLLIPESRSKQTKHLRRLFLTRFSQSKFRFPAKHTF